MDGIEKITERITAETDEQIAALLDAARQEAAAISADYAAQAETVSADLLARGNQAVQARAARAVSSAELAEKSALLAVKQETLSAVFSAALDKLCALPEDEYVSLLARLAAASAQTGKESLILSPSDRSRIGKKVVTSANALLEAAGKPADLTLDETSRPIRGGLYVKAGKIEDNCTLEAIVRLMYESETAALANILFA